jgi:hypothetical protein
VPAEATPAPVVKPDETPAVPTEQQVAPAPKPQVPKDDFKQKPKKAFSLDAPKPKDIQPATDSTGQKPK